MKYLNIVLFSSLFLMAPAFAEEMEIICRDEGPHGIVCHKPDLAHAADDTKIERARYHMERIHLMMVALEAKKPLQPLPKFSKLLRRDPTPQTAQGGLELDMDLGGDIATPLPTQPQL